MAAWTVGAHRARGAGLPARHREAVGAIRDDPGVRWLGEEPLAGRPTLEKVRIRARRRARRALPRRARSRTSATSRSSRACRSRSASASRCSSPIYLSVLPPARWLSRRGAGAVIGALALLPAIAIALLAAGAPPSFSALFVYVAAATGMLLPPRIAARADRRRPALGVGILGVGARRRRRRDRRDRADRRLDRRADGRVRPRRRASTASCARRARSSRRSPSPRSGCGSRATSTTCSATACR